VTAATTLSTRQMLSFWSGEGLAEVLHWSDPKVNRARPVGIESDRVPRTTEIKECRVLLRPSARGPPRSARVGGSA
jgi:hypothetical protein